MHIVRRRPSHATPHVVALLAPVGVTEDGNTLGRLTLVTRLRC